MILLGDFGNASEREAGTGLPPTAGRFDLQE
jgi:hypothetical protein